MGLLAVVVLAFIAVESVGWVHVVNVAVWVIFVLDYVVRLALRSPTSLTTHQVPALLCSPRCSPPVARIMMLG